MRLYEFANTNTTNKNRHKQFNALSKKLCGTSTMQTVRPKSLEQNMQLSFNGRSIVTIVGISFSLAAPFFAYPAWFTEIIVRAERLSVCVRKEVEPHKVKSRRVVKSIHCTHGLLDLTEIEHQWHTQSHFYETNP